eukprot:898947-Amphidinium_carterae.1
MPFNAHARFASLHLPTTTGHTSPHLYNKTEIGHKTVTGPCEDGTYAHTGECALIEAHSFEDWSNFLFR